MSVLKASRVYSVPETTLRDRVLLKIDPETCVMGKVPIFEQYQEAYFDQTDCDTFGT